MNTTDPYASVTSPIDRIQNDVTTTLALFEQLRATRTEIAHLRRHNGDLTAGIMRDEMLCQIEAWLDPEGMAHRTELQAIQGRAAVAMALAIDPAMGF